MELYVPFLFKAITGLVYPLPPHVECGSSGLWKGEGATLLGTDRKFEGIRGPIIRRSRVTYI